MINDNIINLIIKYIDPVINYNDMGNYLEVFTCNGCKNLIPSIDIYSPFIWHGISEKEALRRELED